MGFFARTQKRAADLFDQLKQSVQSFATDTGRDASESARQVKDDLGNKISDAGQKARDAATRMTDAVNDAILATKNGGQRVLDDTADAVNNAMATVRDRAIRARVGVAAGIETMMNGARDLHRGAVEARDRVAAQSSIFAKASVDTVQQATHQMRQSVVGRMTSFAEKLAEKKEHLFQSLATNILGFMEDTKNKMAERIVERSSNSLNMQSAKTMNSIGKVYAGVGVTATALTAATGSPVAACVVAGAFALSGVAMGAMAKTQSGMLDIALKRQLTQDLKALGMEEIDAKHMAKGLLPLRKMDLWMDAADQNAGLQDIFRKANMTHSPSGAVNREIYAGKASVLLGTDASIGLRSIKTLREFAESAQESIKNVKETLYDSMPEIDMKNMQVKGNVTEYLNNYFSNILDRLGNVPVKLPEKLLEDLGNFEQESEVFRVARDMATQAFLRQSVESRNVTTDASEAKSESRMAM